MRERRNFFVFHASSPIVLTLKMGHGEPVELLKSVMAFYLATSSAVAIGTVAVSAEGIDPSL